jgi:DNA-binding LacI/PurR family transcriptional regulator
MERTVNKAPTIRDVAEALGMHKSTVSLAFSGKGNVSAATRARVLSAARELGYEPNPLAQHLARGYRNDMVCLFTGVLDVGLAAEKLLGVQQALSVVGLDVPIHVYGDRPGPGGSSQALQVRQMRRQRPRAIVCASQRVEKAAFRELDAYQRDGGVLVTYDTTVPLACDQVVFDREDNAYRAARYLLDRGHRHLGFGISSVAGPLAGTGGDPVHARLKGFRQALAEYGLTMRDDWFFQNATYERGGAEMAQRFLALSERPTALCIVNDYVALAFMVEMLRAGLRVPEDVSIVSHDNQPIAAYCPVPLTSMSHPVDRIVNTAVALLLDRIQGRVPSDELPRQVTLAGELVERASVAPLTAAPPS